MEDWLKNDEEEDEEESLLRSSQVDEDDGGAENEDKKKKSKIRSSVTHRLRMRKNTWPQVFCHVHTASRG